MQCAAEKKLNSSLIKDKIVARLVKDGVFHIFKYFISFETCFGLTSNTDLTHFEKLWLIFTVCYRWTH